jgi:hypothetical protein
MKIAAGSRPEYSVQLGALIRSAQPAGNDSIIKDDQVSKCWISL